MSGHLMIFHLPMSVWLAWQNAFQSRRRAWMAISSIFCAIWLMFMQLSFHETARRTHTLLYEALDFDLMITSDRFESLKNTSQFPAGRLNQARTVDGVADAAPLNIQGAEWVDPATGIACSCMLIGIDLNADFIRDNEIKRQLEALRVNNRLLADELSHPDYGPLTPGRTVRINRSNVRIEGLFRMGADVKSDGRAIVNQATFYGLTFRESPYLTLGMIKLRPGADRAQIKIALKAALPSDMLIFDRERMIADEQDYYTVVKPIGFFFQAGWLLAFTVGAVILFQVLATDMTRRLREFAVIKAVGLPHRFIYAAGIAQATIYGVSGYIPAFVVSSALMYVIHLMTRMPVGMSVRLALYVLGLSLLMCGLSSALALVRVRRADPAALF